MPESAAFYTDWVATIPWLWLGAGLSGIAAGRRRVPALGRAALDRRRQRRPRRAHPDRRACRPCSTWRASPGPSGCWSSRSGSPSATVAEVNALHAPARFTLAGAYRHGAAHPLRWRHDGGRRRRPAHRAPSARRGRRRRDLGGHARRRRPAGRGPRADGPRPAVLRRRRDGRRGLRDGRRRHPGPSLAPRRLARRARGCRRRARRAGQRLGDVPVRAPDASCAAGADRDRQLGLGARHARAVPRGAVAGARLAAVRLAPGRGSVARVPADPRPDRPAAGPAHGRQHRAPGGGRRPRPGHRGRDRWRYRQRTRARSAPGWDCSRSAPR